MKLRKVVEGTGCLGFLVLLSFNLVLGGWSVARILSWFGKSIPFFFDMVIGLFVGEFSVPIAIVGSILKACGVFQ